MSGNVIYVTSANINYEYSAITYMEEQSTATATVTYTCCILLFVGLHGPLLSLTLKVKHASCWKTMQLLTTCVKIPQFQTFKSAFFTVIHMCQDLLTTTVFF